jgi:hypothetical protein
MPVAVRATGLECASAKQLPAKTDGFMPLMRARDSYLVSENEIVFLMRDGPLEIICQIDLATLSQIGNTTDLNEMIEIFRLERTRIERAASNIYDRTSRQDYEILVVTAADLA